MASQDAILFLWANNDFFTRGHVHMMSAQGGGRGRTPKSVRKLSKRGSVKMQSRGEGVKKSKNFADVVYTRPPRQICLTYEGRGEERCSVSQGQRTSNMSPIQTDSPPLTNHDSDVDGTRGTPPTEQEGDGPIDQRVVGR